MMRPKVFFSFCLNFTVSLRYFRRTLRKEVSYVRREINLPSLVTTPGADPIFPPHVGAVFPIPTNRGPGPIPGGCVVLTDGTLLAPDGATIPPNAGAGLRMRRVARSVTPSGLLRILRGRRYPGGLGCSAQQLAENLSFWCPLSLLLPKPLFTILCGIWSTKCPKRWTAAQSWQPSPQS